MIFVKVLLIVVEIICSLLLIAVVLLQRSKGEGLGLAFGAEMGESLFGARASNVLVRITVWLGVIFLVNTTVLARIYSQGSTRASLLDAALPVAVEQQAAQPLSPVVPAPVQTPMPAPVAPALPIQPPEQALPAPAPAQ